MDCSLPSSPVHGILQAGMPEWVAVLFSGALPYPGMESAPLQPPALAGGVFAASAAWEALFYAQQCVHVNS